MDQIKLIVKLTQFTQYLLIEKQSQYNEYGQDGEMVVDLRHTINKANSLFGLSIPTEGILH